MHPLLNIDLSELSIAERIQLAEDLWDSITETPESVPVTEAQRQELDRRLEAYRQNPSSGSTWKDVRQRLTQSQ